MVTLQIIVQGKVQGVFYRVSAKKNAIQCSITGWVKNTHENHVEIMATGNSEQLATFVEWCKLGPSGARVDKVITEQAVHQQFDEFIIIY